VGVRGKVNFQLWVLAGGKKFYYWGGRTKQEVACGEVLQNIVKKPGGGREGKLP